MTNYVHRERPTYGLPPSVAGLFASAETTGYVLIHGSRKSWITLRGRKVGGWDDRLQCWYISKILARDHEELVRTNGFQWRDNNNGHQWWRLSGPHNAGTFQKVVEALTEHPFGEHRCDRTTIRTSASIPPRKTWHVH